MHVPTQIRNSVVVNIRLLRGGPGSNSRSRSFLDEARDTGALLAAAPNHGGAIHSSIHCNRGQTRNTYPQASQPDLKERAPIARVSHAADVASPTERRRVVNCIHAEG
jgi:hypothetical protein